MNRARTHAPLFTLPYVRQVRTEGCKPELVDAWESGGRKAFNIMFAKTAAADAAAEPAGADEGHAEGEAAVGE